MHEIMDNPCNDCRNECICENEFLDFSAFGMSSHHTHNAYRNNKGIPHTAQESGSAGDAGQKSKSQFGLSRMGESLGDYCSHLRDWEMWMPCEDEG